MTAQRAEDGPGIPAIPPGSSEIRPTRAPAQLARPLPRARASLRLVLVRWRDAWFDIEQPPDGYRDAYVVETVGYLVRETPDVVSVAQELLAGRDGFRAVTHIPRAVIEGITTLSRENGREP